jgi:type I restriction enzyme S subunit
MSIWQNGELGDVLTLQRGFDLPSSTRREGRVPVVSSSGVTGFHDETKVEGPGVVIGRCGTLGEVHFISEDFWPLNTTLYVRDFKGNNPRYCSYLLKTISVASTSTSAAVPRLRTH